MSADSVLDLLASFRGTFPLSALQVVFLQEKTTQEEPHFDANETWMLVHGKLPSQWRGCGIACSKLLGTHSRTRLCHAACSTVLCLHNNKKLGLFSGHISHKFTIAETAAALDTWLSALACQVHTALLGLDANETFLLPGRTLLGDLTLSCTGRGEQILLWLADRGSPYPCKASKQPHTSPTTR